MVASGAWTGVARHAVSVLDCSSFNCAVRIVALLILGGLVVLEAVGGTGGVDVLLGNSELARITRLEAFSLGAFAALRTAVRLARYSS